MKYINLNSWNYKSSLEGLLLFAQLIEEMLFDHTLDSYKVPALNTKSLTKELNITAHNVSEKIIKKGAFKPIFEEFRFWMKNDPIANSLLGDICNLVYDDLHNDSPIDLIIELKLPRIIGQIVKQHF